MTELIDTEEYRGYTIEIRSDDDPENPREWDNFGHMICWHRHYLLGDEQPSESPTEYLLNLLPEGTRSWLEEKWEREHDMLWARLASKNEPYMGAWHRRGIDELEAEQAAELGRLLDKHVPIILPLYLYDHSGITISTGAFSCPWDSGQVGFIYATRKEILDNYGRKRLTKKLLNRATELLKAEVKTYDDYITGSVYGYVVVDPAGEDIDSCWGYYGYDHEKSGLMETAREEIDGEISSRRRRRLAKLRILMEARAPLEVRQRELVA